MTQKYKGFLDSSRVKNPLPATQEAQETQVPSPGGEDPLEEEVATHSSIPAQKIPQTEAWQATAQGVAKSQT